MAHFIEGKSIYLEYHIQYSMCIKVFMYIVERGEKKKKENKKLV